MNQWRCVKIENNLILQMQEFLALGKGIMGAKTYWQYSKMHYENQMMGNSET